VLPNVISYNASICACAVHWRKALELLELLELVREANLVPWR
jgi:hypothetical protein